jgi:hypothetical protein
MVLKKSVLLLIRMLIVGYCCGIRSERRLCEEVHLNLAYRWFCRLGLEGNVPDHSTFSKTRHGRFREADLLRELFETVVRRCMAEGLVGGEGFPVDASQILARFLITRPSAPPRLSSRNPSRPSIRRRDGPPRKAALPFMPIAQLSDRCRSRRHCRCGSDNGHIGRRLPRGGADLNTAPAK